MMGGFRLGGGDYHEPEGIKRKKKEKEQKLGEKDSVNRNIATEYHYCSTRVSRVVYSLRGGLTPVTHCVHRRS